MTNPVTLPEQVILSLVKDGIAAITANTALLDDILVTLSTADRTSFRTYWADHPLSAVSGYARSEGPFPVCAVTLASETVMQDYTGLGEEGYLGIGGVLDGREYKRHINGVYSLHIYAEHPDVCHWCYRVIRRILNVGAERLINSGLDEPTMTGTELQPDPRYTPDQMFIRRLQLTVEYEEHWTDRDSLATALFVHENTTLSATGELAVLHEDQDTGAITPYTT